MPGYLEKLKDTTTLGTVFMDLYVSVASRLVELEGKRIIDSGKLREAGQVIPDTHLELSWPAEDLKERNQGRTVVWATHQTERRVPLASVTYELQDDHKPPLSVNAYEGQEYIPFPTYSLYQEEPGGLIACVADIQREPGNPPAETFRCAPGERIGDMSPEYKQKLALTAGKIVRATSIVEYMAIEGIGLQEAIRSVDS